MPAPPWVVGRSAMGERRETSAGGRLSEAWLAEAWPSLARPERCVAHSMRSMITTPRSASSSRGRPSGRGRGLGSGSSNIGCGAAGRRSSSSRCRICSMMKGGSIPRSLSPQRNFPSWQCCGQWAQGPPLQPCPPCPASQFLVSTTSALSRPSTSRSAPSIISDTDSTWVNSIWALPHGPDDTGSHQRQSPPPSPNVTIFKSPQPRGGPGPATEPISHGFNPDGCFAGLLATSPEYSNALPRHKEAGSPVPER